jgi:hypothetical protein
MSATLAGLYGSIDWAVFDKYPEATCTCRCGVSFRSHAKAVQVMTDSVSVFVLVARKPCTGCGACDDLRSARSDPELVTL